MGVKSTRIVTRSQAEDLLKSALARSFDLSKIDDVKLEDLLESFDEADGNPFTNYLISEFPDDGGPDAA